MIPIYLRLEPKQPIRTGDVKAGSEFLGTRDYIPGSIVRGALAEWMKTQGQQSAIRQVVSGLRFGNFFPSTDPETYSLPLPGTAVECKLHGGFKGSGGHGIRDTLLAALAYSELVRLGARFPVPFLLRCLEPQSQDPTTPCYSRMDRAKGYYMSRNGQFRAVRMQSILQTKVALSRHRRAAQESMLYRVVSLRPTCRDSSQPDSSQPVYFIGRVWSSQKGFTETLCQAVNEVGIGGLTTRGFGRVECNACQPHVKPLAQRLRDFNERLAQQWAELASLANQCGTPVSSAPQGTYFSIDLLSPALLVDRYSVPTLRLVLSHAGRDLEPVWWSAQGTFIGGYSTAWGLPKPTGLGVAPGSTYVYHTNMNGDDLVPWLESLENQGMGLRTEEGLGEILICHPFHEEVKPV